jgi:hypothetical protein
MRIEVAALTRKTRLFLYEYPKGAPTCLSAFHLFENEYGSSLNRPAQVSLAVQDFSISGVTGSQTVVSGGTTSYNITIAAQDGFAAPINFSLSGLSASV